MQGQGDRFRTVLLSSGLFLIFVFGLAWIVLAPGIQPVDFSERNDLVTIHDSTKEQGQKEDEAASDGQVHFDDISELLTPEQHAASLENTKIAHHEVFSNMTSDGNWFVMDYVDEGSYNPNYLPHPYKEDTWIVIAQRDKKKDDNTIWNVELVCEAQFVNNSMRCTKSPMILPIAATMSDYCVDEIEYFNDQIGPHDARVFYGPDAPYIIYMSQSHFNCLGQWIQDLRRITDWEAGPTTNLSQKFFWPTNLQRPPPYGRIEKNWFAFWDNAGEMYLHYDITPDTRVFAKLYDDGSVGEDLAPRSAAQDKKCMDAFMPKLRDNGLEWLHQATNSLAITMCARLDPKCKATQDNTFIMTVFQTKTFYYHGVYEPYVMLFKQNAPFEVHGITTVPFWLSGRGKPGGDWTKGTTKPKDQTEMVFTTSMSFKENGRKYHGYIDDTVILGFGIEDQQSGGIDVVVGELLANLALCEDA